MNSVLACGVLYFCSAELAFLWFDFTQLAMRIILFWNLVNFIPLSLSNCSRATYLVVIQSANFHRLTMLLIHLARDMGPKPWDSLFSEFRRK